MLPLWERFVMRYGDVHLDLRCRVSPRNELRGDAFGNDYAEGEKKG